MLTQTAATPLRTCLQFLGPVRWRSLSKHVSGGNRFYSALPLLQKCETVTGVGGGKRCKLGKVVPESDSESLGTGIFNNRGGHCRCVGLTSEQVRFYSSAAKPKPSQKSLQEVSESQGGAVTLSTAEKGKDSKRVM